MNILIYRQMHEFNDSNPFLFIAQFICNNRIQGYAVWCHRIADEMWKRKRLFFIADTWRELHLVRKKKKKSFVARQPTASLFAIVCLCSVHSPAYITAMARYICVCVCVCEAEPHYHMAFRFITQIVSCIIKFLYRSANAANRPFLYYYISRRVPKSFQSWICIAHSQNEAAQKKENKIITPNRIRISQYVSKYASAIVLNVELRQASRDTKTARRVYTHTHTVRRREV